MSFPLSVESAVLADLDEVAVLFDAYRQFYECPANLPAARQYIEARLLEGDSTILIARDASRRVVGFTQLYPTFCSVTMARIFVLYDLFVQPSRRGAGVGRALMSQAQQVAREAGAARMDLRTARTNVIGQRLYESLGWEKVEWLLDYSLTLQPAP